VPLLLEIDSDGILVGTALKSVITVVIGTVNTAVITVDVTIVIAVGVDFGTIVVGTALFWLLVLFIVV